MCGVGVSFGAVGVVVVRVLLCVAGLEGAREVCVRRRAHPSVV